MIQQIQDLVRFYAQKHHVPIQVLSDQWQTESWDREGLAVTIPSNATVTKTIGDMAILHEPSFAKFLPGNLITCDEMPVARIGKQWLVLLFCSQHPPAISFAKQLLDQHLPKLCRTYRHEHKNQLVEAIAGCVGDRKRELQSSIREDSYELERLSLQVMQLSRKLETDRHLLEMFQHSPQWIRARANRTFCDLMKLVPAVYESFRFEDESVIGVTHEVDIDYDGYTYHFDPYEVTVNLRQGKVFIGGGTNVNGYIHPHCTDEKSNVCWGSCGSLIQRLAGEIDLLGLFQLVHTFLTSYNASDPYQKIERWSPDYEEPDDDDSPYCSWCDSYDGHTISECDECHFCEFCGEYVDLDHDEENCPNRPKEETEEVSHEPVADEIAA
ncbi:MAG TPA: hypothetical protein VGL38_01205 [bacterium]|jgi:hypothetical protein